VKSPVDDTRTETAADTEHGSAEAPNEVRVRSPERFLVIGEHGRGGIGRVLRAHDRQLGRDVAVKELIDRRALAERRFLREARITARLEHPGIVPVYDVGFWPSGEPFYEMKLIDGESLRDLLGRARDLDERLVLIPNVLAVAEAIAFAHEKGVIHRDIKPSNVVVGRFGETVVIDWGLAKELAAPEQAPGSPPPDAADKPDTENMTRVGSVMGTPAYMPPEQARGDAELGPTADVYALGALLYHLLTGSAPYAEGGSGSSVLDQVRAGAPPPVTDCEAGAPRELAAIVEKAMARTPSDRYGDASGFAADLLRFQQGQFVAAHHYNAVERLWRWVARHRAKLLGVALAASLAVAAIAVARGVAGAGISCDIEPDAWAGIWDRPTRSKLGEPGSPDTPASREGEYFVSRIDSYVADWNRTQESTCRETHEEGTRAEADYRLITQCLARQKSRLGAIVRVAQRGDEGTPAPLHLLDALVPTSACLNLDALRSSQPDSPESRRKVERLYEQVDRLWEELLAGNGPKHLEELRSLYKEADATGFAPIRAKIALALAGIEGELYNSTKMYELAKVSAQDYAAAGDNYRVGQAFGYMVAASTDIGPALSKGLDEVADIVLARLEGLPETRYDILDRLSGAASVRGDYQLARSYLARGQVILEQQLDEAAERHWPGHLEGVANVESRLGNREEAVKLYEQAVARAVAFYGEEHHVPATQLANLAMQYTESGRPHDAEKTARRAMELFTRLYSDTYPSVAHCLALIGGALLSQNRVDEALEVSRRSVTVYTQHFGADHPRVAQSKIAFARTLRAADRTQEATAELESAVKTLESKLLPNDPWMASVRAELSNDYIEAGRFDDAEAQLEKSYAVLSAYEPRIPAIIFPLFYRTSLAIARKDPQAAARWAQETISVATEFKQGPEKIGAARALMAKALLLQGKRSAARQEAKAARAILDEAGHAKTVAEVDEWLAETGLDK